MKRFFKRLRLCFLASFPTIRAYFSWAREYGRHPEKYPLEVRYAKCREFVLELLRKMQDDYRIENLEIVPKDKGVLYIGNHQSVLDPLFLIATSEKPIIFIAKKETKKTPIISSVMKAIDSLFLDREDPRQAIVLIRSAVEGITKKGLSYCIFPEGTRNKDPYNKLIGEFHAGSFKIASKAKCPIVYFANFGTFRPFGAKDCHKYFFVQTRFVKVLNPEEYEGKNTVDMAEEAKTLLAKEIEDLKQRDLDYEAKKLYKNKPPKWWELPPLGESK